MCNRKHHQLLHHVDSKNVSKDSGAILKSVHSDSPKNQIIESNGTALTYALLDSKSEKTLISEHVVKEVGMIESQRTLEVTLLSDK